MALQGDWPILRVGAHLSSDDGACLMELVSVAAGEPWSDHPACTHPLLAHVARRVNDATSDRRRSELAGFIPALTRANSDSASVFARIAASCTQIALAEKPSILLDILHSVAVRRSTPGARRHTLYIHGAAFRSVDLAVFVLVGRPTDVADEALRRMLGNALQAVAGPRTSLTPTANLSPDQSGTFSHRETEGLLARADWRFGGFAG